MALINRISRLFKADFHAILDQIEEPGQLLRQAIRDMQDELAATEQRIALYAHEQETLLVQRSELESALAETDGQLDLCFESKKHELAMSLIRKKLEAARTLKRVNAKHSANEKYLSGQRTMLAENRTTLEGLRQKAELFAQRAPTQGEECAGSDDVAWAAREMNISDDEVQIAYLREKSLRSAS